MKQFLEPWYLWAGFTFVWYVCTYHLRRWIEDEAQHITVTSSLRIKYKELDWWKKFIYNITGYGIYLGVWGSLLSFVYNFIRACIS